ncbi:MAG: oligosaccharide flippase family protein [Balneolaceae bacterium]|nr:oligosaccharide flippase family protein [Balneolaceae bacterium]
MKSATSKIFTLFKQSITYSAGNFLNKFLLFLMVPLYAEFILPEDLSLLEILDPAEQFIYGVLNLGMVHAFYRFYNKQESEEQRKKVISTVFWFITFMAILVVLMLYLFADPVIDLLLPAHSLARICYLLTLASLFFRYYNLVASAYLNSTEQARRYSIWNIAGTAIFCFYNFYFLFFREAEIDAVFEARVFSMIPVNLVGIWACRSSISFSFDLRLLKKMLGFSYPFILSAAAYPILNYVDRWMLSELASPEATGVYGMSYRFGMIPGMLLVQPFLKAWRPFIYNYDDEETRQVVYQRILLYYTLVGAVLWLGLSVYSRELIVLFTSEAYYDGHVIIPYVACSQLFYGLGWIVVAGLAVKDKTFFIGFCTFLAGLLNILLNYLWIPEYEILGAAYATVGAFLMIFLGYAIYSYIKLRLSWPITRFVSMILFAWASFYVISFIPVEQFWIGILWKALALLCPIVLLAYMAGLNLFKLNEISSLLAGDEPSNQQEN